MRALLLSATVLFAFVVASAPPEAQAQRTSPNADSGAVDQPTFKLRCTVYVGVHIAFQNMGTVPIPSGTKVHWSLPSGAAGNFNLPVKLDPTVWVLQEYALPTPVRARRCSVVVI